MFSPAPSANNFESARQSWEDAGTRLFSAMSDYLGALSKLSDMSDAFYSPADRISLVSRIDYHLSNLDTLPSSYLPLGRLRNRYNVLFNTLPVEIIAYVFQLFVDQSQPILLYGNNPVDIYQRTTTLASVCHQWRRIAFDSHYLWSLVPFVGQDCHLDENSLPYLWLDRGASTPLYLIVRHQQPQPITVVPKLTVHAARFRTLSIVEDTMNNIYAIISCWFDHGAPGSVTELAVSTWNGYAPLLPPNVYDKYSREAIDNFLRPLRVLHLKNVYLDWDSAAYEGLVKFRLEARTSIHFAHLTKVLKSSPCLSSLMLGRMRLGGPEEELPDHPVSLLDLQTLYLDDIIPQYLGYVFHLIEPGAYDVHLNFSARSLPPNESGGPMNINGLEPVFPLMQRFNVASLSLERRCEPDSLRTLLQSLPRLHTLYLHDVDGRYDTAALSAMTEHVDQELVESNSLNIASLRAIHLMGLITDRDAFKTTVSSHCLQQLSIGGWVGNQDGLEDSSAHCDISEPEPTEELCMWASENVSDFVCCRVGELAWHVPRLRPFLWRLW